MSISNFLQLSPEKTLCIMDNEFSDMIQTRYYLQLFLK